eukprot:s1185_g8.t1
MTQIFAVERFWEDPDSCGRQPQPFHLQTGRRTKFQNAWLARHKRQQKATNEVLVQPPHGQHQKMIPSPMHWRTVCLLEVVSIQWIPLCPWTRTQQVQSSGSGFIISQIVRRRDSPMDNALAHISQQVFGHIILPFASIWHIGLGLLTLTSTVEIFSMPECFTGLALISYNTDLWRYDHSLIVIIWFTAAGALTALFLLLQFLAFKLGYYAWGKHQARRTMSSLASTASLGSSLDPADFREKDLEDLKHELEADANLAAPSKQRDGTDPVTEMEMISHPGKVPEVTGELVHQDPARAAPHETAETAANLNTPTNGAWHDERVCVLIIHQHYVLHLGVIA